MAKPTGQRVVEWFHFVEFYFGPFDEGIKLRRMWQTRDFQLIPNQKQFGMIPRNIFGIILPLINHVYIYIYLGKL